jgi:hypothetical protein
MAVRSFASNGGVEHTAILLTGMLVVHKAQRRGP